MVVCQRRVGETRQRRERERESERSGAIVKEGSPSRSARKGREIQRAAVIESKSVSGPVGKERRGDTSRGRQRETKTQERTKQIICSDMKAHTRGYRATTAASV